MHRPTRPLLALALLLSISSSGCDLFAAEDTTIAVSGRAVTAEGAPIAGLGITLDRAVTLGSVPEARTTTDADGRFSIVFDPGDTRQRRFLYMNNEPYNPRYKVHQDDFRRGERRDIGDVDMSLPTP